MIRRQAGIFGVLAALALLAGAAIADIEIPALKSRVTDLAGMLSATQKTSLEEKLKAFEARKGSQIALLIVPTTQPEVIEQYSMRVVDSWKLGRQGLDDGALLLIAKNDRELRIEVGYGLEGALTDADSNRIVAEVITPLFKHGDFFGGIDAGLDRMMSVIDGEPLPPPQPSSYNSNDVVEFLPAAVIIAFVTGGVLRSFFGRFFGSATAGGVTGFVVWLIMGVLSISVIVGFLAFVFSLFTGAYTSRSGWSDRGGWGGGYGHWGGGGRGGFGGGGGSFGGGGGGFGGGGASGGW